MVESCSKKVAASGVLHSLLQFQRGVLAALCYISAAKGKYANSAGGIFEKIPLTTYKPEQSKNDGDFRNFFKFPFQSPLPKEKENCQRFQKFFLIFLSYPTPPKNQILPKSIRIFFRFPPRRSLDFANSISPFHALIPGFFQNAEFFRNFFQKQGGGVALRRKMDAKKQETLLLISCLVCRPPAAVIQL